MSLQNVFYICTQIKSSELYFAVIPDNEAGNYKGDQGHLDGGKEKKAEVSASKRCQKCQEDKYWKSNNGTQGESELFLLLDGSISFATKDDKN